MSAQMSHAASDGEATVSEADLKFIRLSYEVAQVSRENGNHPFGALLVSDQGELLLRGENSVITKRDCTGHAELNLLREASRKYSRELLATCTIYASTEPCPMCSAAIFWANVKRVVFGLGTESLNQIVGDQTEEVMHIPAREVLSRGRKHIEVLGPVLEEEGRKPHNGFWR